MSRGGSTADERTWKSPPISSRLTKNKPAASSASAPAIADRACANTFRLPLRRLWRLGGETRCGVAITPGDAVTLANALRRWSEEPQTIAEMGARARQMLEEKFTKAHGIARWSQLVDQLAAVRPN